MATTRADGPGLQTDVEPGGRRAPRGTGWLLFAGIILMVAGVLNVIYGIAAISNSKVFVNNAHYVFSDLNTWGWVTLILGIVQICAAGSLFQGGAFGRAFGICAGVLAAIGALLSLPAYPLLSLAIFALDVMVIYGLATYEGDPYGA
jgi:hypothetical protein